MEDILTLYTEPLPKGHEVHCFDETPKPLRGTPHGSIPMKSGRPAHTDYEYTRDGGCNVFVAVAPFKGKRTIRITDNRKAGPTADFLWDYCMRKHRKAVHIHLVLDNLNTHSTKSLTRVWGEAKAKRFFARVTFHYTPCHASWLNMAEIEIGCIRTQGLKRRIPTKEEVTTIAAAIEQKRNTEKRTISWSFTVDRARTKFPSLYRNITN